MISLAAPTCARCHRPLKSATPSGYGPKCERAVLGRVSRKKRAAVREVDPRQMELLEVTT